MAVTEDVLTGIVVAHTHWDREWYLTYERFRTRLVDTLDVVLDALDRTADGQSDGLRYFTLDGQTVAVEDYLAIRPQDEARLARHVREGRLLVGPWYVLADAFLSSAESLVRNLLLGREIARRYGHEMRVGYLPDTFGHAAQLPQILAGFGIDAAVIYRGVRPERSEFWWEAPDGTRALTAYLANSYCNASTLNTSPHLAHERMQSHLEDLRRMRTTSHVLVMAGCDHQRPRPDLGRVLGRVEPDLGLRLRQGTLSEYLDLVRSEHPNLPVLQGEFRTGRPARITPGVISTRGYLKRANFQISTSLERVAEPLSALAWLLGERYPTTFLVYAWRKLVENTPHDSITGCSIDRVHRDMQARFDAANDVATEMGQRAAAAVARHVAPGDSVGPGGWLTFNTLFWPRTEVVRQRVHFLEPVSEFHLVDAAGRVVPHQIVGRRPFNVDYEVQTATFEQSGKAYPLVPVVDRGLQADTVRSNEYRRWAGEEVELLQRADLPACGYATFYVRRGAAGGVASPELATGDDWAENARLRVQVHQAGTFDVLHKATGQRLTGLGALESSGDRGDEYTYCPPEQDAVCTTRHASGTLAKVESGPMRVTFEVRTTLRLPRALEALDRARRSSELVDLPVVTRIHLSAGSQRVEVQTTIDNVARDHRLRVSFPTAIHTDVAHAQGQFLVDVRPIDIPEDEKRRVPDREEEVDVASFPHKAFVDVNDGTFGLAVLNRGLTEYQVEPAPPGVEVKLTLLRCVGWLSRDDLSTRYGHAGPPIETPDAQCPGTHTFEYAVLPHAGDWLEAEVHRAAESYVTPFPTVGLRGEFGALGDLHSFVEVDPGALVFSALKKAEGTGDALILRVYNTTSESVSGRIHFGFTPRRIWRATLAEDPVGDPLGATDGEVDIGVRGHEILTLRIEP